MTERKRNPKAGEIKLCKTGLVDHLILCRLDDKQILKALWYFDVATGFNFKGKK